MIAYLIVRHDMWYRLDGQTNRELTVLFNATTLITMTIGALPFRRVAGVEFRGGPADRAWLT
mgnify:CR=1 FL=1